MSDLLEQLLAEEEGRSRTVYKDTQGLDTIGIGCLVDAGRPGAGLCDAAIDIQFAHDATRCKDLAAALEGFEKCNSVRQVVLQSMCFQLGNLASWPKFRAAIAAGDYQAAAAAGRDSDWCRTQTPRRAEREMRMMESGAWIERADG